MRFVRNFGGRQAPALQVRFHPLPLHGTCRADKKNQADLCQAFPRVNEKKSPGGPFSKAIPGAKGKPVLSLAGQNGIFHFGFRSRCNDLFKVACLLLVAIAAINRAFGTRLERNFARFSARCANCVEHLAITAVSAGVVASLAGITAPLATLRLIGEPFVSEKFLFAGRECELLTAILADEGFVFKHGIPHKKY